MVSIRGLFNPVIQHHIDIIVEKHVNQVDKTNDGHKNIQTLSITLNNIDNQIQENHKQIQTLTENNEGITIKN